MEQERGSAKEHAHWEQADPGLGAAALPLARFETWDFFLDFSEPQLHHQ